MAVQEDSTSMRFGNYEVLTRPDGKPYELGRGGFGRTYRARHSFLGTEMALKVIIDRLAFDEAAKKRFLKEAREHARLNHPGIARIADFGEAEGTFFYAMELCPDGDLKEYVKKTGPVPPVEALQLIRQTAEALYYAHRRNILHRDIKPSNLLLVFGEATPQVKLIDFGLVKRIVKVSADETIDHESASQWSPAFASPEQIREHALDERTDVFSLGMTAWFLIQGGGPMEGATMEIVQERLGPASYEPRLPASLTGRLRAIVARMVEKDTAVRYRNFGELLEDLRQALDGAPELPSEPRKERGPLSLADRFTLQPAGRVYLGEVFRGLDRQNQTPVRVTVVYKEHDPGITTQTAEKVKALAASQPPGLVPILEMTEFAEGWAVIEEETTGSSVAEVLRREGTVSFAKLTAVLWDAATGLDAAVECGATPAPLEQALLEGVAAQGPVDWSIAQIHIPLQLASSNEEWTESADVTIDQQQTSPLKSFAGLVYLAVGGRHATAQSFFSSSAYIAIPGLSSNGNRVLSACLAGEGKTADCRSLMQALFADEGVQFDGVVRRAQERRLKALENRIALEMDRIDRATTSVDILKAGRTGHAMDEVTVKTSTNASIQAAKLHADLKRSGGRDEAAYRTALQEFRTLAAKAEAAATACAERSQTVSKAAAAAATTATASVTTRSVTAGVTTGTGTVIEKQTEALHSIESAAHQAKELSEQALRLKMPAGMDDSDLSRQQVEARRWSREALSAWQQAQELSGTGQFDKAAAASLSASASRALGAVSSCLEAAHRLVLPPRTAAAGETSAPPPLIPPLAEEQPAVQLQPATGPVPALTIPKKKSSAGLVIALLFLAAAGGGGWYYYQEEQKKKAAVVKNDVPPKREETPKVDVTPKKNAIDDPKNGNSTVTTIPEPPKPRQVVLIFSGDLPEQDSAITFSGAQEPPKAARSDGKLSFVFSLPHDAANPKPNIDTKKYTLETIADAQDRVEYKVVRQLPPDSLRLTGIAAVNPGAVTVGRRFGKPDGTTVFFTQAAEKDGRFQLDAPCWQPKAPPRQASPGVWEVDMELKLFPVKFSVPADAQNAWQSVTFTPANLEVLPSLKTIRGLGLNGSASETELKFVIDSDDAEAVLPAGDYQVKWQSAIPGQAPYDGGSLTIFADKPNTIPVPPSKKS
ncbi:MAG TPA: protein kinase [Verrucomicrobiales bacterium]|nr:protein kinase [Verrucomicrobiales bacterium]